MEMIKRDIFSLLQKHLKKPEITMLVGPRQAGKTTLMLEMKRRLDKEGENTIHLNLDKSEDKPLFQTQKKLVDFLDLEFAGKPAYVFIDEIQRVKDAGLFLKGLYDRKLKYKLVVSGSGSIELKEDVIESLAGRKRIFNIPTITFREFVNYRTAYKYVGKITKLNKVKPGMVEELLDEYLKFGGYPRVVLAETKEGKIAEMEEIYNSYLEKDIEKLLNVSKSQSFSDLVTLISSQAGALVNNSELSNTLGIDFDTVKKYLWFLSKTFILHKVTPYYTNVRKELSKMPIYYFYDLGMRNYALNKLTYLEQKFRRGFLFQNFVYNVLWHNQSVPTPKYNFWRSKGGAEVDFVVRQGVDVIPIEVKYSKMKKPETSRALESFIGKYQPKRAFVVCLSLGGTKQINGTAVKQISYVDLIDDHQILSS